MMQELRAGVPTLYLSADDAVLASYLVDLAYIAPGSYAAAAWPAGLLAAMPVLDVPELCRPRGLTGELGMPGREHDARELALYWREGVSLRIMSAIARVCCEPKASWASLLMRRVC